MPEEKNTEITKPNKAEKLGPTIDHNGNEFGTYEYTEEDYYYEKPEKQRVHPIAYVFIVILFMNIWKSTNGFEAFLR